MVETMKQLASDRVLLVDDEPQVRAALARLVRAMGLQPVVAATGDEAIALAEQDQFRAVVTDLRMPGIGGVALLQRLAPILPCARFIVLTAAEPPDACLLPRDRPCFVFNKPWEQDALLSAILGEPDSGRRIESEPPSVRPEARAKHVLLLHSGDASPSLTQERLELLCPGQYRLTKASHRSEARVMLRGERFDAICLDTDWPDREQLDAIAKFQAEAPNVSVVTISSRADEEYALRAVNAGAQECLFRDSADPGSVVRALRYAIERKTAELRLAEMAFQDQLTGLMNRMLLRQRIAQAIGRARRGSGMFAVLLLDIDRFKDINEAFGHDAGDALLQVVAERLRGLVRETDTVARFSGDEFAVILEDVQSSLDVQSVARKLLVALREPVQVAGTRLVVTVSIGGAVYPQSGTDCEALLAAADAAMYAAKERGRDAFELHGAALSLSISRRLRLETSLRFAVEQQQFALRYQPQVDCDGGLVGVEALLRWRGESGKWLPARDFMPILEDTGLIVRIGAWIIESSCRQLSAWRQSGYHVGRVAINISAKQVLEGNLLDVIHRATERAGLHPSDIELELTETTLLHDTASVRETLQELATAGYRIALDDFGTGYSSLAYLQRLSIATLKIDRCFVDEIASDRRKRDLLGGIVELGRRLGIEVVAEGVETETQREILLAERCDVMQGYLFGPALEHAALVERLERHRPVPFWNKRVAPTGT